MIASQTQVSIEAPASDDRLTPPNKNGPAIANPGAAKGASNTTYVTSHSDVGHDPLPRRNIVGANTQQLMI
jgi:hypothetical protein